MRLLEVVELDAGHVLLREVGVVSGGGVGAEKFIVISTLCLCLSCCLLLV